MSATPQQVVDAALAALNGALTPTAYDADQVPSPRPAEYVGVTLIRRFGGVQRGCGTKATVGYRLMVAAVSQVEVSNVRTSLEDSRGALEYVRLTAGTSTSTPIQFETETAAATKDGWSEGRQFYTFVVD